MVDGVSCEGFASDGGSICGCHFTEVVNVKAQSDRADQFEFQIGVCGAVQNVIHCCDVIDAKGMGNVGAVSLQLGLEVGKVAAECVNELATHMGEGQSCV